VSDLVIAFRGVDVGEYPDVHALDDDLDAALWVLMVGTEKLDLPSMTAADVSTVLTTCYLRPLARQRAAVVLSSAKGLVVKRPKSSPARFSIMRAGCQRVRGKRSDVLLIEPERAFSSAQQVERLLGGLQGDVMLCDPYVDDKTLVHLTTVPKLTTIRLLTLHIGDSARFRQRLTAYEKEFGNLEVRVSLSPDLHDRYLLDDDRMWLFGASLNGIGKKQSFVVSVGTDVRNATHQFFLRRWNQSPVWR
jgi:hypothetical protein